MNTRRNGAITLTEEEKTFIRAYRRAPQGRKEAVKILLEVQVKGERRTGNGTCLKAVMPMTAREH